MLHCLRLILLLLLSRISHQVHSPPPPPPRSITGVTLPCEYEALLANFLPSNMTSAAEGGAYHIVLSVSDNQLVIFLNFMSIGFALQYFSSPRLKFHFLCHGPKTTQFIEQTLRQKCRDQVYPSRQDIRRESEFHQIVKNRLHTMLDIMLTFEEEEEKQNLGVATFDLDSLWIRNFTPIWDHFSVYDYIAMSTIMQNSYKGKLITNFGCVFYKNSMAGQALALQTRKELNSGWRARFPDQDYVTKALMQAGGEESQQPLPPLASLLTDRSLIRDSVHCKLFPGVPTCGWSVTGAHGSFSFPLPPPPVPFPPFAHRPITLTANATNPPVVPVKEMTGRYMYLPQAVAPRNCDSICSPNTVITQHCGLAYCLRPDLNNLPCMLLPNLSYLTLP